MNSGNMHRKVSSGRVDFGMNLKSLDNRQSFKQHELTVMKVENTQSPQISPPLNNQKAEL
jgi:hypothetical protein